MCVLERAHLLRWGCDVEVQGMVQRSTPVRPSEDKTKSSMAGPVSTGPKSRQLASDTKSYRRPKVSRMGSSLGSGPFEPFLRPQYHRLAADLSVFPIYMYVLIHLYHSYTNGGSYR